MDGEKFLWSDGDLSRTDLVTDPREQHPWRANSGPAFAHVRELGEAAAALASTGQERPGHQLELVERLRALGYAD